MTTHPRELVDHAGHRRMSLRSRWLRDVEARGAAPLIVGPAVLDVYTRRVMINGYQLRLPAREAALLRMLMLNPDRVVPVTELATVHPEAREDHVVRLVGRLRRRLTYHPLLPPLIEAVGLTDYRFTTRDPDVDDR